MADNELLEEELPLLTLIPGETIIGKEKGRYREQIVNFTYYYGNHTEPMITKNGKQSFIKLKDKEYLKILNNFLESEKGVLYKNPTNDEILEANKLMQEKEEEIISSKNKKQEDLIINSPALDEKLESTKKSKGEQSKVLTKSEEEIINAELENIKQIKEQRKTISELQRKLDSANRESKKLKEEKEKAKKKHIKELVNASKDQQKLKEENAFSICSALLVVSAFETLMLLLLMLYK